MEAHNQNVEEILIEFKNSIFNPEDKKSCAQIEDEELNSTPKLTHALKRSSDSHTTKECPSGYTEMENLYCIHRSERKMNYNEAKSYCSANAENAVLLNMKMSYDTIFNETQDGNLNFIN